MPENRDDVNVLDDQPELLFGPEVDGKTENGGVLTFYSVYTSMTKCCTMQCLIQELPTI